MDLPDQLTIWDDEAARRYDTPGRGMFAPDVLGPTVDRLVELAEGDAVLELAIGTGRVAVPLVERGVAVTGIELSPAMIRRLRTKVTAEALPVVEGDMATTRAPGEFGLVYLVYNTISNLQTQEEQVRCFRNAARHLRAGGRFVIELWVPELGHLHPRTSAVVAGRDEGWFCVDTYDAVGQRCVSHHVWFGTDGARVVVSPHRYIWPSELDLMAHLAGFERERRDADWRGEPFTATSPSHVSVYRLAGAP